MQFIWKQTRTFRPAISEICEHFGGESISSFRLKLPGNFRLPAMRLLSGFENQTQWFYSSVLLFWFVDSLFACNSIICEHFKHMSEHYVLLLCSWNLQCSWEAYQQFWVGEEVKQSLYLRNYTSFDHWRCVFGIGLCFEGGVVEANVVVVDRLPIHGVIETFFSQLLDS